MKNTLTSTAEHPHPKIVCLKSLFLYCFSFNFNLYHDAIIYVQLTFSFKSFDFFFLAFWKIPDIRKSAKERGYCTQFIINSINHALAAGAATYDGKCSIWALKLKLFNMLFIRNQLCFKLEVL